MITFWTILSGVFVFVLGQTILKLFVEPWQMQRECIAKISNNLTMYANVYSNPGVGEKEELKEVSKETRKLAAELIASSTRIPFYEQLAKIKVFPSLSVIKASQGCLIGLSNGVYREKSIEHNDKRVEQLTTLLKIK